MSDATSWGQWYGVAGHKPRRAPDHREMRLDGKGIHVGEFMTVPWESLKTARIEVRPILAPGVEVPTRRHCLVLVEDGGIETVFASEELHRTDSAALEDALTSYLPPTAMLPPHADVPVAFRPDAENDSGHDAMTLQVTGSIRVPMAVRGALYALLAAASGAFVLCTFEPIELLSLTEISLTVMTGALPVALAAFWDERPGGVGAIKSMLSSRRAHLIELAQSYLIVRGARIPWREVREVSIDHGHLAIESDGRLTITLEAVRVDSDADLVWLKHAIEHRAAAANSSTEREAELEVRSEAEALRAKRPRQAE